MEDLDLLTNACARMWLLICAPEEKWDIPFPVQWGPQGHGAALSDGIIQAEQREKAKGVGSGGE